MSPSRPTSFQHIGFSIKPTAAGTQEWLKLVSHFRDHYPQCQLYLEQANWSLIESFLDQQQRQQFRQCPIQLCELSSMLEQLNLLIAIGGDGTLIAMAQHAPQHQLPVLGINLGRLGYLADVTPESMRTDIDAIMNGDYWICKRLMLTAEIIGQSKPLHAINEISICRSDGPRLVDLEIHIDDRFLVRQRSDGLIINTATGSTAYALAAGGPIISARTNAICITPVSPHTLSYRPLVIGHNRRVTITVHNTEDYPAHCSADGLAPIKMHSNQTIRIRRSHLCLELVHPVSYDEFETLRTKLGWGR